MLSEEDDVKDESDDAQTKLAEVGEDGDEVICGTTNTWVSIMAAGDKTHRHADTDITKTTYNNTNQLTR